MNNSTSHVVDNRLYERRIGLEAAACSSEPRVSQQELRVDMEREEVAHAPEELVRVPCHTEESIARDIERRGETLDTYVTLLTEPVKTGIRKCHLVTVATSGQSFVTGDNTK